MDVAPAGAAAAPVSLFRIARAPGHHSLVVSAALRDFTALHDTPDALLVSVAVDDPGVGAAQLLGTRSSLGDAVRACSSHGVDVVPAVAAALAAALAALAAPPHAVQLVCVPLPRTPTCRSLWVALLPAGYDQDSLAALYAHLKAAASATWPTAAPAGPGAPRGGTLVMPLIGKHPRQGVHTRDVVQELLSLAEHCGRAAPGLATVQVVSSRADTFAAALVELRSPEYAILLAPQLPAHLGALAAVAASPALPPALRWPCEVVVLTAALRVGAPSVGSDAQRTALFASTCCLQARTILDWLLTERCGQRTAALPCGHLPGGEEKLRRAHAAGALSDAQLQLGRSINRHGNKAAHAATLDGLTLTDCNSVLTSLLQLLRDFQVS
jgi:hypothetical protein